MPLVRWLALAGVVVVLDQLGKAAAEAWLQPHTAHAVLPGLNLTLVYNTGAAFSMLSQAGGWQRWLLAVLAAAVSAFIVVWLARLPRDERWTALALSLIMGGAIGNLVDRLLRGYVVDFVDIYYGSYHWPAFNVADSAITVGAVILIVYSLFFTRSGSG